MINLKAKSTFLTFVDFRLRSDIRNMDNTQCPLWETRTRKAIAGINGTPQSASAALSRPCLADFQTPLVRGATVPIFLDEASRDSQHQGSYNILDQNQSVTGIKKHWATKETRERTNGY